MHTASASPQELSLFLSHCPKKGQAEAREATGEGYRYMLMQAPEALVKRRHVDRNGHEAIVYAMPIRFGARTCMGQSVRNLKIASVLRHFVH